MKTLGDPSLWDCNLVSRLAAGRFGPRLPVWEACNWYRRVRFSGRQDRVGYREGMFTISAEEHRLSWTGSWQLYW